MTYGYGDPPDGWPADPDPAPGGRRRLDEGAADGHWPGSPGSPDRGGQYPRVPDARTSQWDTPATDRAYGHPADRGNPPTPDWAWGGAPPATYPGPQDVPGPRRGESQLTGRYAPRTDGPAVSRPPAGSERGWDDPRGRAPQAWQDDVAGDRDYRGYADAPGRYDDEYPRQRARSTQYGAPPGDPRTRPAGYPPRPRSGERYYDEGPDDFGRGGGRPGPGERKRGPFLPILAVLATLALLAVCGAGFYVTFLGGKGPDGNGGPTVHDISNQGIDPAPLTVAEVFPAATITLGGSSGGGGSSAAAASSGSASSAASGGVQPYQVVKAETAECKSAVVGDLVALLANSGCSQVVRATLLTADQQYVVTTGLFNLKDDATAKQVNNEVKGIVNATKGRFTGFMAGGATDVIGRAKTQLAWDTRGHFLIYCVIARADSQEPDPKSPAVTQMVTDLVETYLNETVLTNRTLTPPAVPSSGASASSAP